MSHNNSVLYSLVKSTFALFLDNENAGENCEQVHLVEKLDERIERLRNGRKGINNELLTSLKHLKSAVVSLRGCFKNLEKGARSSAENSTSQDELPEAENQEISSLEAGNSNSETEHPVRDKTKQPNDLQDLSYTAKYAQLQKEVLQIETSKEFVEAMKYFIDSKTISAKVFENESERETKITATKVRVISEILGNLTNLRGAAEKCMKHISQLHEIFSLQRSSFPTWYKALSYVKLKNILESQEMKGLDAALHINAVVFRFIKEYIRKPVAMFNWPTIDASNSVDTEKSYLKTYHPILGEQPPKTNKPDPFTEMDKLWSHDSHVSAVNCSGDVFTKEVTDADENPPIEITRITPSGNRRYGVDDEHKRMVLSISIDCADCATPNENSMEPTTSKASSQSSEASFKVSTSSSGNEVLTPTLRDEDVLATTLTITPLHTSSSELLTCHALSHQEPPSADSIFTPNHAQMLLLQGSTLAPKDEAHTSFNLPHTACKGKMSFNLPHTACKGKMYILTYAYDSHGHVQYFLYVIDIDMDGIIQHKAKLGFLESTQLVQAKIFYIREKKLILLDVTRHDLYICDNEGKHLKTIDMTAQLRNAYFSRPQIFTISYNGEVVCSEGRRPTKLNVYNIVEESSTLSKPKEIILKRVVQAVAFNHESDELIILCYTSILQQYHLVIYTKAGELKQDIKLGNGNYREAKLIFHPSGPVVLLDNRKLFHLK